MNRRTAAGALTISTALGASLLLRGWPYFEWGRRGFPDIFYVSVVIITSAALLGVITNLVPRRPRS
ncbi:MAG TPA: hypothetical protein VGG91_07920 [Myxococcaceae bacterium]